jgi:hypothetical protein
MYICTALVGNLLRRVSDQLSTTVIDESDFSNAVKMVFDAKVCNFATSFTTNCPWFASFARLIEQSMVIT